MFFYLESVYVGIDICGKHAIHVVKQLVRKNHFNYDHAIGGKTTVRNYPLFLRIPKKK